MFSKRCLTCEEYNAVIKFSGQKVSNLKNTALYFRIGLPLKIRQKIKRQKIKRKNLLEIIAELIWCT